MHNQNCQEFIDYELNKAKLVETIVDLSNENELLFNIILVYLYNELLQKLKKKWT